MCDSDEQSWAVKAVMNAVLGLKECVTDEQSWAVKAEL